MKKDAKKPVGGTINVERSRERTINKGGFDPKKILVYVILFMVLVTVAKNLFYSHGVVIEKDIEKGNETFFDFKGKKRDRRVNFRTFDRRPDTLFVRYVRNEDDKNGELDTIYKGHIGKYKPTYDIKGVYVRPNRSLTLRVSLIK